MGEYYDQRPHLPSTREVRMPAFSFRVRRDLSPNALAAVLAQMRCRGRPVLDLTVSNPTKAALPVPEARLRAALAEAPWMLYEPDPRGRPDALRAVAAYYSERGIEVSPASVLLTASTSEAYSYIFKLLTEPGRQVLVPRPSYPLFEFLAAMEGVELRFYDLHYDGEWSVDLGSVEAGLGPEVRAVVVVHPNNPTGSFLRTSELAEIGRLCRERDVALVADEVFVDYAFGGIEPARLFPGPEGVLSFTLNGLSKLLALPQLKLGWMILGGPKELTGPAIEALELIADTYLSVGTPVQAALPGLLALRRELQAPVQARLSVNLEVLRSSLARPSPCSALRVDGGWSAVLRVPATRSSEAWAVDLLRTAGVLVHPGSFFGFRAEAFLVISLLARPAEFAEGLARLLDLCSGG
jgi:hypothetical protein